MTSGMGSRPVPELLRWHAPLARPSPLVQEEEDGREDDPEVTWGRYEFNGEEIVVFHNGRHHPETGPTVSKQGFCFKSQLSHGDGIYVAACADKLYPDTAGENRVIQVEEIMQGLGVNVGMWDAMVTAPFWDSVPDRLLLRKHLGQFLGHLLLPRAVAPPSGATWMKGRGMRGEKLPSPHGQSPPNGLLAC
jgi:hypothetical protein